MKPSLWKWLFCAIGIVIGGIGGFVFIYYMVDHRGWWPGFDLVYAYCYGAAGGVAGGAVGYSVGLNYIKNNFKR